MRQTPLYPSHVFAVAILVTFVRSPSRFLFAALSTLATYLTAAVITLACAPVDVTTVAAPARSETTSVCTLDSPSTTRPEEYAAAPEPNVIWSYEADVGSDSAPTLTGDSLYIATGINQMYSLEAATGRLRWRRELVGVPSAPPLALDGVLYVSGEFWDEQTPKTGVVFAIDASNGDQLWRYDIPRESWGELWADPVVVKGMVYVGSFNGRMYALDAATGELRWSYTTGGVIRWPAVVEQDTEYFGSTDGYVYALDAFTGDLRWRYETEGELWIGPVVIGGSVYQGPGDSHLYALDAATGDLQWRYTRDAHRWSLPVVADAVVYASANRDFSNAYQRGADLERIRHHGYVTAIDAHSGRLLWEYRTAGEASGPVVIDGLVYVSASDERSYLLEDPPESGNPVMRGHVYALNAVTGDLIWQRRVVAEVGAGPRALTVIDGTVYVRSSDQFRYNDRRSPPAGPINGQISAFDASTGETKWLLETDDQFPETPAVRQGVAYATSYNGQVCALRAPS